jgi:hypothetical protein
MPAPLLFTNRSRARDVLDLERVLHRAERDKAWTNRLIFVSLVDKAKELLLRRLPKGWRTLAAPKRLPKKRKKR